MKHSEEKYVKHILLVRCCRGADKDDYLFHGYAATECRTLFHKFEEYIAYMWRVQDGKSVFYRNVVNFNLII